MKIWPQKPLLLRPEKEGAGNASTGSLLPTSAHVARAKVRLESPVRWKVGLLFEREGLAERLLFAKRYFLAGQGDFLVNFMDSAASELEKRADHVS